MEDTTKFTKIIDDDGIGVSSTSGTTDMNLIHEKDYGRKEILIKNEESDQTQRPLKGSIAGEPYKTPPLVRDVRIKEKSWDDIKRERHSAQRREDDDDDCGCRQYREDFE
jgi:hypothetical protein